MGKKMLKMNQEFHLKTHILSKISWKINHHWIVKKQLSHHQIIYSQMVIKNGPNPLMVTKFIIGHPMATEFICRYKMATKILAVTTTPPPIFFPSSFNSFSWWSNIPMHVSHKGPHESQTLSMISSWTIHLAFSNTTILTHARTTFP